MLNEQKFLQHKQTQVLTWLTCTGVKIKSRTPDQPANTPSGIAYAKAIIKNLKLLQKKTLLQI